MAVTTTTTGQCALPIPLVLNVTNNVIHPHIARLNLRLPLGGNTRRFLMNWEILSSDREILSMVQGLRLEWVNKPQRSIMCHGPKFSQAEQELIHIELTKMLEKGVIEQTVPSDKQFVGHLFLVPKKMGD